ncbi:MAG TPA: hypothetical protein VLG09_01610 [Candidatus Saccharimonadales bacterium]|nr:hypothetical protein [Candidatus Saccharimonadales bacterium]
MTAPERTLNAKQKNLVELHKISPTFDLEAALKEFESKPRGRPARPKNTQPDVSDTEDAIRREGRFLLEHLENRNVPFVRKTCLWCNRDFLCSYKCSAYCSDDCRAARYHEKYGFIWNPENSEINRWEFWKVPPSTVKPETLRRLEAFARAILGIPPTEEDLALPAPEIAYRPDADSKPRSSESLTEGKLIPSVGELSAVVRSDAEITSTVAPIPVTTPGQASSAAAIRARFAAGEITAHELQVELAAAFRG